MSGDHDPHVKAMEPVIVSERTRAEIGAEVIAFMEREGVAPDIILSDHDLTSQSFPHNVVSMLEAAGIGGDDPRAPAVRQELASSLSLYRLQHYKNATALDVEYFLQSDENLADFPFSRNDTDIVMPFNPAYLKDFISVAIGVLPRYLDPLIKNLDPKDFAAFVLFHESAHTIENDGWEKSKKEYMALLN